MRIYRTLPITILAILAMGTGPCGLLEDMMGADGGDFAGCGEETCEHQLLIEVLRADNDPFMTGSYTFSLQTPDASVYSIDCFLIHQEVGFECALGDLDVMYPYLEENGNAIWVVVAGAPESVLAVVEFNGYIIGERTLVPLYDEIYPNGADCLPICYTGEEQMAVTVW